jgi:hypothetical protein
MVGGIHLGVQPAIALPEKQGFVLNRDSHGRSAIPEIALLQETFCHGCARRLE